MGSGREQQCQRVQRGMRCGCSPRQGRLHPSCQSHTDFWPTPGCFGEGGLWLHLELVPTLGCLLTSWLFLFPVALQMPEGLLMFACTIADIIER